MFLELANMTEYQLKALNVLNNLIVEEYKRVKAINELGIEIDEFDETSIENCIFNAMNYKNAFNNVSIEFIKNFIKCTLIFYSLKFNDIRCYSYLEDVILDEMKYF